MNTYRVFQVTYRWNSSTRQMTSIYPKSLVFVIFPPFVFCILFGIKQIWHPCGVSTRNNLPLRGLLPSGYALERQSSPGEVIIGGNATGMSYLYNSVKGFGYGSCYNTSTNYLIHENCIVAVITAATTAAKCCNQIVLIPTIIWET